MHPTTFQTHLMLQYPSATALPATPDEVKVTVHLQAIGDDVLTDLVASGDLDASLPPLVAKYDVGGGAALEWTPSAAKVVVDPNTLATLLCVTSGNYRPNTVRAASHVECAGPTQP